MTTNSARLASLLCVLGTSSALASWNVVLSPEEKTWIEQHPVVKVAHSADYGPFRPSKKVDVATALRPSNSQRSRAKRPRR